MKFSLSSLIICVSLLAVFFVGWTAGSRMSKPKKTQRIGTTSELDPALLTYSEEVSFIAADFRKQIEKYVQQGRYSCALELLMLASCEDIASASNETSWYCAIDDRDPDGIIGGESRIRLPGIDNNYDLSRDWIIPDSGWRSRSDLWDRYSRTFAERFNRTREKRKGYEGDPAP